LLIIRRKLPAFEKVKELINSNVIDKIVFADIQILQSRNKNIITKTETNRRLNPNISGGGYFHDIAPHQLNLMYYYFGKIRSIQDFSTSSANTNVDNIINGIIEFKNEIQFRGVWNFNISEKEVKDNCKIYGEKAAITFSYYGEKIFVSTYEYEDIFNFTNPKHI
jgi:predicted dehydrogenase